MFSGKVLRENVARVLYNSSVVVVGAAVRLSMRFFFGTADVFARIRFCDIGPHGGLLTAPDAWLWAFCFACIRFGCGICCLSVCLQSMVGVALYAWLHTRLWELRSPPPQCRASFPAVLVGGNDQRWLDLVCLLIAGTGVNRVVTDSCCRGGQLPRSLEAHNKSTNKKLFSNEIFIPGRLFSGRIRFLPTYEIA